jgi:hypothetical protein
MQTNLRELVRISPEIEGLHLPWEQPVGDLVWDIWWESTISRMISIDDVADLTRNELRTYLLK